MAAQMLELEEHIRPARLKLHLIFFFSVGRRGGGLRMKFHPWINAHQVKFPFIHIFKLNFALKIPK